jgi:hypothetical protein
MLLLEKIKKSHLRLLVQRNVQLFKQRYLATSRLLQEFDYLELADSGCSDAAPKQTEKSKSQSAAAN